MRIVIQRVRRASVSVDGSTVSSIGPGMMILVGVETGDTPGDVSWLAGKAASLRIFNDSDGVMNCPVTANSANSILAVSQFTLTASTRKGNRPSYIRAARGDQAQEFYNMFCNELAMATGLPVLKGVFGADMAVELINDGPVTIIIDSRLRE